MENLGTTADLSEGSVEIVNPLELTSKVLSLLGKSTVATSVTCTLLSSSHVSLGAEDSKSQEDSKKTIQFGTVTEETDITFSFNWTSSTMKNFEKSSAEKEEDKEEKKKEEEEENLLKGFLESGLPFQVQLEFTNDEEKKMKKVISMKLPVTTQRSVAEEDINSTTISLHAIHESARVAQSGPFLV